MQPATWFVRGFIAGVAIFYGLTVSAQDRLACVEAKAKGYQLEQCQGK